MARNITPKKFIEVWQTSSSSREVAQRLNMKATQCSIRASNYRKKGIPLKKFPRGKGGLDISGLADYALSLEKKPNATETRKPELQKRVRPGPFGQESQEGEGS